MEAWSPPQKALTLTAIKPCCLNMKIKILLNTIVAILLIPVLLILGFVFPHSLLREFSPRFLLLIFFIKIIYDLFTKERMFLTGYIEQQDRVTFIYLNQFGRTKKIDVMKEQIQKVELIRKRRFWRPFDILTLSNKQHSLKFEFKDESFRQLAGYFDKRRQAPGI